MTHGKLSYAHFDYNEHPKIAARLDLKPGQVNVVFEGTIHGR